VTATRPDATPLFTEKLIAQPWREPVRRTGAMGMFDVFANMTLVTPRHHADRIFEQAAASGDAESMAGASRLPGDAGLSYKVIGTRTAAVQSKVRAFWSLVRREVLGAPLPPARLWG
jgi:urease accessory protein